MNLIITIVLAIAISAAMIVMYVKTRKDNKKSQDDVQKTSIEEHLENAINSLLFLNIEVREHIYDMVIVDKIEHVIDLTRNIIYPINELENISELTTVVNRMGTSYLPRIVMPYIAMDAENRTANSQIIVDKLKVLIDELLKIKVSLANKNINEFNKQASFITAMFPADVNNI